MSAGTSRAASGDDQFSVMLVIATSYPGRAKGNVALGPGPTLIPVEQVSAAIAGIHPFVDEGLGNSSYLVEIGDRRALVIDPPRDFAPYRQIKDTRCLSM